MKTIAFRSGVLMLLFAPLTFAAEAKLDIRNGVPADAYMAVFHQHNPERDFQRTYQQQVWETIQHEKLAQRIVDIVFNLLPSKEKETATSVSEELQSIFEPVDWLAVADSPEVVYGQVMYVPQTHHLVLLRLPSEEVAASIEIALKKMGEMVERRSDGAVDAALDESDKVRVYSLSVPKIKEFPFQPSFSRLKDVLVLSTSDNLLRKSVDSLLSRGDSKFDDPRLQAALAKLPEPEDGLIFYDGRQQFSQMRGIGNFIREKAADDAKAVRFAGLFEQVMDELAILDYEVTVEYTEGQRNIKTCLGQLLPDAENKLLYQVFASGKAFENWQGWIPADSKAYSLTTGANLHPLYEWVIKFLRDEVPEAQPALEKFEQAQQEWGVHLDRDILQSFSGESVSVRVSTDSTSALVGSASVLAMRCEKPERIRELLHQAAELLEKNPYAQSQQLKLTPSAELEGFDDLSANMLVAFGARPLIGFKDGWMIVASNSAAAQKLLRTRSGEAPSIDRSEQFEHFGLKIEGPVYSISYTDLTTSTRQAAQFIRQAGAFVPMAVATAAASAKADPEKLKPLQDAVALIPSIANVVEKFDYLQARLSVVQVGDASGSYVKRSVTLVRPPVERQGKNDVATAESATEAK
jgi:hypothetical protein